MEAPPAPRVVCHVDEVEDFLSMIPSTSSLYLSLEGTHPGRNGDISILTIALMPEKRVRVIDVHALGSSLFTAKFGAGKTLKSIFENPDMPKIFWDSRSSADALWAHYRVKLASIIDLQLLENASRTGDKTWVRPLETAVQHDLNHCPRATFDWMQVKAHVEARRRTHIFDARPISAEAIQYCLGEVGYLPQLHALYLRCIRPRWLQRALAASADRLAEARSGRYDPGDVMSRAGPWGRGTSIVPMTMRDMAEEGRRVWGAIG
jgi:exonuclease 3'-5' domain-containing protein 1